MRNIKHMVTPDLVVSAFLSVAVIVGMVMGTPTEVLTGLVGGLTGYLGKTVQDSMAIADNNAKEIKKG